ncbi:MAG TPA: hypothetical protein PLG31_16375 [Spirochaetota bacterium]|nr:hypothetical protein [Spirochaetota bacterium]
MVVVLALGGVYWMSSQFVGYNRAGNYYIGKQRTERKSVRVGSAGYYGRGRPGGIRTGK